MKYLPFVLAGIILALGFHAWRLQSDLESKVTQLAGMREDLRGAVEANAGAQTTIGKLEQSLRDFQSAAAAREKEVALAVADAQKARASAAAAAAKIKVLEASDATLPNCQTVLNTDLATVCPGHAAGLLKRAGDLPR